jgi:hypothetical protein
LRPVDVVLAGWERLARRLPAADVAEIGAALGYRLQNVRSGRKVAGRVAAEGAHQRPHHARQPHPRPKGRVHLRRRAVRSLNVRVGVGVHRDRINLRQENLKLAPRALGLLKQRRAGLRNRRPNRLFKLTPDRR